MRIALIGSAPSSVELAPYHDASWTIWGCSPGASVKAKRLDAWFEIHPIVPGTPCFQPEYVSFMQNLIVPVYLLEPFPGIQQPVIYPKDEMVREFGQYFFTSSIAWMFALAISKRPKEIGLWGVDMSATEEYGYQRAGCHYFIQLAQSRGIKVTVPLESDLLQPPPLYGLGWNGRMAKKLAVREKEIQRRLTETETAMAQAKEKYDQLVQEVMFLRGAIDDIRYMRNTWVE